MRIARKAAEIEWLLRNSDKSLREIADTVECRPGYASKVNAELGFIRPRQRPPAGEMPDFRHPDRKAEDARARRVQDFWAARGAKPRVAVVQTRIVAPSGLVSTLLGLRSDMVDGWPAGMAAPRAQARPRSRPAFRFARVGPDGIRRPRSMAAGKGA